MSNTAKLRPYNSSRAMLMYKLNILFVRAVYDMVMYNRSYDK